MDNAPISFGATSEQSTFMGEQPLSAAAGIPADPPQPIPMPSQSLPGQALAEQTFPAVSDSPAFSSDPAAPVSYSEAAYGATNSSEYQQQYDGQYDDGTDKKTFQMNPHASIFRSMYTEPQQGGGSSGGYNNNYNQRGFSSHRSNNGVSRGGRGGPKGASTGMNNGYARGGGPGPRGASSYGGSSNGRGGSSGNSYNRGGSGGGMRGAPSSRGSSGSMRGGSRGGATSYARSMQQGNMS